MSVHAGHAPEALSASVRGLGESTVLTLTGTTDRPTVVPSGACVEAALTAVEIALVGRPRVIIADLTDLDLSPFTIGLLGLIRRRTARAGVALVLAGLTPGDHDVLERTRVAPLYPTYPTVPAALGALGRDAGRRR